MEFKRCTPSTTFISMSRLSKKTVRIFCAANDQVGSVKVEIQLQEGIPPYLQRLIFAGKQLDDERTLADYNIKSVSHNADR